MIQSRDKRTLPVGETIDWPTYQIRGFFIDDARKFFPLSFLKDYVRFMGWFKLNTFHIHLNDNDFLANATDPTCKFTAFSRSAFISFANLNVHREDKVRRVPS